MPTVIGMFSRMFSVLLAILIANPICCCQGISSWLVGSEPVLSCACHQDVEGELPGESPCQSCSAKQPKVAPEAAPEVPGVQLADLQSPPAFRIEGRRIDNVALSVVCRDRRPLRDRGGSLRVEFCVFLI